MIKTTALFGILLSISIPAIGQNQITCRIIDAETKEPVKEARVFVGEKSMEAVSNFLGYFQITVDTTDHLIIKKPFYETGVVKVPSGKGFQIQITKRKQSDYEGGLESFAEFIKWNIRYPAIARRNHTQGTVYVSFAIDSLGQMNEIKTIKDIGNGCGTEVVALLKRIPGQWIPAETATTFVVPVTFKLSDSRIKAKNVELPEVVYFLLKSWLRQLG